MIAASTTTRRATRRCTTFIPEPHRRSRKTPREASYLRENRELNARSHWKSSFTRSYRPTYVPQAAIRENPPRDNDDRPTNDGLHDEHLSTYRYPLIQLTVDSGRDTAGIRIDASRASSLHRQSSTLNLTGGSGVCGDTTSQRHRTSVIDVDAGCRRLDCNTFSR